MITSSDVVYCTTYLEYVLVLFALHTGNVNGIIVFIFTQTHKHHWLIFVLEKWRTIAHVPDSRRLLRTVLFRCNALVQRKIKCFLDSERFVCIWNYCCLFSPVFSRTKNGVECISTKQLTVWWPCPVPECHKTSAYLVFAHETDSILFICLFVYDLETFSRKDWDNI